MFFWRVADLSWEISCENVKKTQIFVNFTIQKLKNKHISLKKYTNWAILGQNFLLEPQVLGLREYLFFYVKIFWNNRAHICLFFRSKATKDVTESVATSLSDHLYHDGDFWGRPRRGKEIKKSNWLLHHVLRVLKTSFWDPRSQTYVFKTQIA